MVWWTLQVGRGGTRSDSPCPSASGIISSRANGLHRRFLLPSGPRGRPATAMEPAQRQRATELRRPIMSGRFGSRHGQRPDRPPKYDRPNQSVSRDRLTTGNHGTTPSFVIGVVSAPSRTDRHIGRVRVGVRDPPLGISCGTDGSDGEASGSHPRAAPPEPAGCAARVGRTSITATPNGSAACQRRPVSADTHNDPLHHQRVDPAQLRAVRRCSPQHPPQVVVALVLVGQEEALGSRPFSTESHDSCAHALTDLCSRSRFPEDSSGACTTDRW